MAAVGINTIIEELKRELNKIYGSRLVKLVLYGSAARGDSGPHSDIDIILVLKDLRSSSKEIDRISDILADMNMRYGVLVSVLPVDSDYYSKAEGPFWRNVQKEGIAA